MRTISSCSSPLRYDSLAHVFVGEKSNGITAIPGLLEMLNLKGAVVTIDAMGIQRPAPENIVEKGGDYILSVKGNHGRPYDEIRDQCTFALRRFDSGDFDPPPKLRSQPLHPATHRAQRPQRYPRPSHKP